MGIFSSIQTSVVRAFDLVTDSAVAMGQTLYDFRWDLLEQIPDLVANLTNAPDGLTDVAKLWGTYEVAVAQDKVDSALVQQEQQANTPGSRTATDIVNGTPTTCDQLTYSAEVGAQSRSAPPQAIRVVVALVETPAVERTPAMELLLGVPAPATDSSPLGGPGARDVSKLSVVFHVGERLATA